MTCQGEAAGHVIRTGGIDPYKNWWGARDRAAVPVVRIEREPELMIITNSNGFYPQDVQCGYYFRLSGSDAYGEHASAELARARLDQMELI